MKRKISLTIYLDSTGYEMVSTTINNPESIRLTPISEPQEVEVDFVGLDLERIDYAKNKIAHIEALEQELKILKGY